MPWQLQSYSNNAGFPGHTDGLDNASAAIALNNAGVFSTLRQAIRTVPTWNADRDPCSVAFRSLEIWPTNRPTECISILQGGQLASGIHLHFG